MPNHVPEGTKSARSRMMIEAAAEGEARFRESNAGQTRRTLIFGREKGGRCVRGLTDNGIDVRIKPGFAYTAENVFADVKL